MKRVNNNSFKIVNNIITCTRLHFMMSVFLVVLVSCSVSLSLGVGNDVNAAQHQDTRTRTIRRIHVPSEFLSLPLFSGNTTSTLKNLYKSQYQHQHQHQHQPFLRTNHKFKCRKINFCDTVEKNGKEEKPSHLKSVIQILQLKLDSQYYRVLTSPLSCSSGDGETKSASVGFQNFTEVGGECYVNYRDVYYAPKDYCILKLFQGSSIKKGVGKSLKSANKLMPMQRETVAVQYCRNAVVFNKCCELGQVFREGQGCQREGSMDSTIEINPNLPRAENSSVLLSFRVSPFHSRSQVETVGNSRKTLDPRQRPPGCFQVNESGIFSKHSRLGVYLRGKEETELTENYCVETLALALATNLDGEIDEDVTATDPNIIFFYDLEPEIRAQKMARIIGVVWLSGVPLSFMSALANFAILQRNVAGLTLSTYFLSCGFIDIFAAIHILGLRLETWSCEEAEAVSCNFVDFAQKFAYSSTTFWLAIVNFDLWWNFRELKSSLNSFKHDLSRFIYYSIFGIGGSSLHVLTAYLAGRFFGNPDDSGSSCVFYSRPSLMAYSGVTLLLILINTSFFIVTWRNIRKYKESTRSVHQYSNAAKSSFRMYTKLFLMAGPNRLVRIVILFCHFNDLFLTPVGVGLEILFSLPDLLLFLLVFCHQDFCKKFGKIFPCFKDVCCSKKVSAESPGTSTEPKRHIAVVNITSTTNTTISVSVL